MIITAFSAGGINKASSRLRSYYLFHFAYKYNIKINRKLTFNEILKSDSLHIQKAFNVKSFIFALFFRFTGRPVIFDFDDQPSSYRLARFFIFKLALYFLFILYIFIATNVTVDTRERAVFWRKLIFFRKPIIVLPDVIDVDPNKPFPKINLFNLKYKNIFWLGDQANFISIEQLVLKLEFIKDIKLTVAINPKAVYFFQVQYPWVDFIPWEKDILFSREDFIGSLMVLNHGTDKAAYMKSENKMVLAIVAGLIPLVSSSPAYKELAKKLHASNLVFKDDSHLLFLIRKIHKNKFNLSDFYKKNIVYIRKKYDSEVILKKFIAANL